MRFATMTATRRVHRPAAPRHGSGYRGHSGMEMLKPGSGALRNAKGSYLQHVKPASKRRGAKASDAKLFCMQLGLLVRKATNIDNYKHASGEHVGTFLEGYTDETVDALEARYRDAAEYLGNKAKTDDTYREHIGNPDNRPDGWAALAEAEVNRFWESDPRKFKPNVAFTSTWVDEEDGEHLHYPGMVVSNEHGRVQVKISDYALCCVKCSINKRTKAVVQECRRCREEGTSLGEPKNVTSDDWPEYEWSAPHEFEGCAITGMVSEDETDDDDDTLSM